jgi:hypothetical protein
MALHARKLLSGTNTGNAARIAGANRGANPPVYRTAYELLSGSATEAGNSFGLECENAGALQSVTYAASVTPNPYLAAYVPVVLQRRAAVGRDRLSSRRSCGGTLTGRAPLGMT